MMKNRQYSHLNTLYSDKYTLNKRIHFAIENDGQYKVFSALFDAWGAGSTLKKARKELADNLIYMYQNIAENYTSETILGVPYLIPMRGKLLSYISKNTNEEK